MACIAHKFSLVKVYEQSSSVRHDRRLATPRSIVDVVVYRNRLECHSGMALTLKLEDMTVYVT